MGNFRHVLMMFCFLQLLQDVKPILKRRLIESKEAVSYMEPEKTIISRSGDECVVALCDQVKLMSDL